jgi:CBS domain-containing protein
MIKSMVKDWMSSPVVVVPQTAGLDEARKTISENHIRALPVMEGGNLIGIVTRRGLLRLDLSSLDHEIKYLHIIPEEKNVGDVMTRNVITILPNNLMPKAARIMLENKITALPVLENRQLVGIITNSDLLHFIIEESANLKRKLLVNQYMTDEVVTIDRQTNMLEAHRLMGTKRIRSLVVTEGDRLIGVVTRTDLMSSDPSRMTSRNQQDISLKILSQPVEKVMSTNLITISEKAPLTEAAELMLKNKIHCLPVLNQEKKLAGIITESDLFLMIVQKFY